MSVATLSPQVLPVSVSLNIVLRNSLLLRLPHFVQNFASYN